MTPRTLKVDQSLEALVGFERSKVTKMVGLVYKARVGEDHQKATLSDAQVEDMRDRYEAGVEGTGPRVGYKVLAREFGVSRRTVRDIVNYRRRVTYPERWKRIDNL